MREILFRGRDKYTNEWFYGFVEAPHTTVDGVVESYYFNSYVNGKSCRKIISADTLGQYTGLTDKNGNKIFEGDIVKSCEYGDIYTIRYFDDYNYPAFDCVPEIPSCDCNGLTFLVNTEGCEIIGNIRDNPELLSHRENLGN